MEFLFDTLSSDFKCQLVLAKTEVEKVQPSSFPVGLFSEDAKSVFSEPCKPGNDHETYWTKTRIEKYFLISKFRGFVVKTVISFMQSF